MASANSITVRVKRYSDRKNLILWYRDPITEKNGKHQRLPITQDFYAFLMDTPEDERSGNVFGMNLGRKQAGCTVSKIGEKAGVITGRDARTESRSSLLPTISAGPTVFAGRRGSVLRSSRN